MIFPIFISFPIFKFPSRFDFPMDFLIPGLARAMVQTQEGEHGKVLTTMKEIHLLAIPDKNMGIGR